MTEASNLPDNASIVVFDGECKFCNGSINSMIDRDPHGHLRFVPRNTALGRDLLAAHQLDGSDVDTVVLIESGRAYTKSTAVLAIAGKLTSPWKLLTVFRLIPRALRDWCYDAFARRRYRWFGKMDACRIPTPEVRSRFLA